MPWCSRRSTGVDTRSSPTASSGGSGASLGLTISKAGKGVIGHIGLYAAPRKIACDNVLSKHHLSPDRARSAPLNPHQGRKNHWPPSGLGLPQGGAGIIDKAEDRPVRKRVSHGL
jgi:hypothetical protein